MGASMIRSRPPRAACACLPLLLTVPASATTPSDAVERSAEGLLADVERIVDIQETLGWYLDDEAYRDVRDAMMRSVCKATPRVRQRAVQRLADATAEAGDPVHLFSLHGEVTSEVSRARSMGRRYEVLMKATEEADEVCPFWEEPDIGFEGRQTDRNRFTLSLETGGLLQIRRTQGTWTYGGGGAGRLLAGYGFGGDVTLLGGAEFGGGALLVPDTDPTEFAINYFPAVPVIVRLHQSNFHYDLELAPVGLFQASDTSVSYGG
ncbi:MAG: hypothetical protein ACOC1F_09260, partial [Myxococcota bacterium]